jgi:hypothetical protein
MTVVMEQKECTNCAETHETEEMSHCLICDGHFCTQCWCDCTPFTNDELAELAQSQ